MEKIGSENGEKTEKKDRMLHIQRLFLISDELFSILKPTGKTGWIHHSKENSMLYKNM